MLNATSEVEGKGKEAQEGFGAAQVVGTEFNENWRVKIWQG
jgi:hypothetical protein